MLLSLFSFNKIFLNIDNEIKNNLGLVSKGYLTLVKVLSNFYSIADFKFKEAMIGTEDIFKGNKGIESKDVTILILIKSHSALKKIKFLFYFLIIILINLIRKINRHNAIISDTFLFYVLYESKCSPKFITYSKSVYNVETDSIIYFELEKI